MGAGIFSRIFNALKPAASSASPPQARVYDSPPEPAGEWGLVVDAAGRIVQGRPAGPQDFLARYPVEYDYRGTIPKPDKRAYPDRALFGAALMAHEVRDFRNSRNLQQAVLILSQTDDGRRLLEMARQEKFHFVFDQQRMENEGALGLCDYANKQIPLAEGRTPEEVALTLKHELQHMEDFKAGVAYNHTHTLHSSIIADRALEANARVSEAAACVELLTGSPRGPERQFKSTALFAGFFEKNGPMAALAHRHLADAQGGNWDKFAAKVFDGYYQQTGTLDYYDDRQAKMYAERVMPPPDEVFAGQSARYEELRRYYGSRYDYLHAGRERLGDTARHDRWTYDQDRLKGAVRLMGRHAYLQGKADIDFLAPERSTFGAAAAENLRRVAAHAGVFAPERREALIAELSLPEREPAAQAQILSPYTVSQTPEPPFESLRHPHRTDRMQGSVGAVDYDEVRRHFARRYDEAGNYSHPLDRMMIALMGMGEDYRQAGGWGRMMNELVSGGFRAPVAALPEQYIVALCGKVRFYADNGGTAHDFTHADRALMNHWQEMAERGIDPVYGGIEVEDKERLLFADFSFAHYSHNLKPFIDRITANPADLPHRAAPTR